MKPLRRRLLAWLEAARSPPPVPAVAVDRLGDHLRAAVAADARAKAENVSTYHARVEAMIDDFFAKYGAAGHGGAGHGGAGHGGARYGAARYATTENGSHDARRLS